MKIRNGFVSNSSSSSFIIGLAKVTDLNKAAKLIEDSSYETRIIKFADIHADDWGAHRSGSTVRLESFRGDKIQLENLEPNDYVLVVDICNDEGDTGFFSYDEQWGGIDYDIDLNYFTSEEQKIYNAIANGIDGLASGQVVYGAARNG